MLRRRFEHTGDAADLAASEDQLRAAIDACSHSDADAIASVADLGAVLRLRFEQGNGIELLHEAVRLLEHFLPTAAPAGRAVLLNSLGQALRRRHEHSNYLTDLQSAIDCLTEAAAADSDLSKAAALNNLGGAYSALYHRTRELTALAEAVRNHRQAVEITPRSHAGLPVRLANLASTLCLWYQHDGDTAFLDEAVDLARQAVDATEIGDPERARRLTGLGRALELRYDERREPADMVAATQSKEKALGAIRSGSVHEAEFLIAYGTGPIITGETEPSATASFDRSASAFIRARDLETALVRDRATAARNLALLTATSDPRAAIDHAAVAFDLLAAADWHGLPVADQADLVRQWTGFAGEAAEWALADGQPLEPLSYWVTWRILVPDLAEAWSRGAAWSGRRSPPAARN